MNYLISIAIRIWNFFRHISMIYMDYWDALLVTGVVWLLCSSGFGIHKGISLLIGLTFAILLYLLFRSRIGFWIVTPIFSYIWTWFFVDILLVSFFGVDFDKTWYAILFIAIFAYNCYKHWFAVGRKGIMQSIIDCADEDEFPPTVFEEFWFDEISGTMKPINEKPANADTPEYKQHVREVLGQREVDLYEAARKRR